MQCFYGSDWECTPAEPHWNELPFNCTIPGDSSNDVAVNFDVMEPEGGSWDYGTFPSLDLQFSYKFLRTN